MTSDGLAAAKFTELGTLTDSLESASVGQQSGFGEAAQQFEVKGACRENLREDMANISRTAKSMEYAIDGIADKFAFTRKMPDADLLAKAYAFLEDIPMYKAAFITYGLPAAFDGELEEAAEAFEASLSTVDGAVAEHIAGTADVAARVREGMVIIRILDGIVKNVYNGNPGKFAAWTAAAHVERDPKPKTSTPPTP